MPARNPINKNRRFEMHILIAEKKPLEHIPDGHAQITFRWKAGVRQWEIEGLVEPESPFLKPKHNWETHVSDLPQGQGDAIITFLEWVQYLTERKPSAETNGSGEDIDKGILPS